MNKLVAGGCSFTGIYTCKLPGADNNFDRWPSILADKMSLEVINLGQPGVSNHTISQRVVSYISKWHTEIDSVYILWTDWNRIDCLYNQGRYTSTALINLNDMETQDFNDRQTQFFYKGVTTKYKAIRNMLHEYHNRSDIKLKIQPKDVVAYNLMPYKNVELACKAYDIKCKFLQGIAVSNIAYIDCSDQDFFYFSNGDKFDGDYFRFEKEIDESILMNDLNFDKSSFINNLPLTSNKAISNHILEKLLYFGESDTHPTKKGHKFIADVFANEIKI